MFEPQSLTPDQIALCKKTISSNAFYMLVGDALVNKKSLSVVRMGDGERQLMQAVNSSTDPSAVVSSHPEWWLKKLGCFGITYGGLHSRLHTAANYCDYFAPSVSGILSEGFHVHSLFTNRREYVDNFFVNAWTEEMKIQLFKAAGHVLFIHRSTGAADAMQIRAKYGLGVKVTYLKLESWQDADGVVDAAHKIDAPLVLFSAGPASKYIGPIIAKSGATPKVTLDIGNAADYWLLESLKDAAQGRR